MILSHAQIEDIAAAAIKDFNEFFFGIENNHKRLIQATPIDQFARDYLGLEVSFAQLSIDGSICGLTAYADTEYVVEEIGATRAIPLKQNQVLLDVSLIKPGQVQALCGKRRFTLAHECAHQILFQMESDEMRLSCKKNYAASTVYSLRDLKTREDWNEWQANVLGAAILMPQNQIDLAMWYFAQSRTLTNYEGRFSYNDWLCLTHICHALGVRRHKKVQLHEQENQLGCGYGAARPEKSGLHRRSGQSQTEKLRRWQQKNSSAGTHHCRGNTRSDHQ